MVDFAFYSTEISPTLDPANAVPAPVTLVVLTQPPFFGNYAEPSLSVRGSVHPTLGGVQIQDFGSYVKDGRISFSDTDALTALVVSEISSIAEVPGAEYYFTDGFDIWKIMFSRPDGFMAYKNLLWAQYGNHTYSYEINLIVIEKPTSESIILKLQAVM